MLKCNPAVGAATDPSCFAYIVWYLSSSDASTSLLMYFGSGVFPKSLIFISIHRSLRLGVLWSTWNFTLSNHYLAPDITYDLIEFEWKGFSSNWFELFLTAFN